jgi:RNA polymerase sigma-70 factor (ECF subfamily)
VSNLSDHEIIELYQSRCESAIEETAKQYGSYCLSIAMNILGNREDSDECLNDTWLKAWNSIPPEQPRVLPAFLAVITRNLSLNKYKARNAQKRSADNTALLLSELESCIPAAHTVEGEVDSKELARTIDAFLATLRHEDRVFFVRRYWHADSVPQIARRFGEGESKVKMSIHRTRKKFKVYLDSAEERGIQT